MVGGGGEARQIAHHPSAEGDEDIIGFQIHFHQGGIEGARHLEGAVLFLCRHDQETSVDACILQGFDQVPSVQFIDRVFRDDGCFLCGRCDVPDQVSRRTGEAVGNKDVVGIRSQADVNFVHNDAPFLEVFSLYIIHDAPQCGKGREPEREAAG